MFPICVPGRNDCHVVSHLVRSLGKGPKKGKNNWPQKATVRLRILQMCIVVSVFAQI